ncbi:MAG: threonine dehydratase [Candidatus Azotimanducaceae bacterium]|jgi:threonine dehydratase
MTNMTDKYIRKILEANVYEVAQESALEVAPKLSEKIGRKLLLKREDTQSIFSFKLRGAFNKIQSLPAEVRQRGVITASAGNHAQGVALAAQHLKVSATIVMGRNTPLIKIDAVRRLGAKVLLEGDSYDEAAAVARKICEEQGFTYVHPFDDPDVIAGQGTIGMEILRQYTGPLHAVFVPVGGGGLISGVGTYIKYLRPDIRVIGVEADGSAGMWAALQAGRRVKLAAEDLDQFADGTAVRQVGKETFRLAKQCVDEVIRVSTDEICAAIKDVFEDARAICEPSGALGIAGCKQYFENNKIDSQDPIVAVVTGANMNFDRLRHVSERTDIGEKREMLLGATIPEKPGSFRKFCRAIGKRSVTEFNYRYAPDVGARVLVGIQTVAGSEDRASLFAKLTKSYDIVDLSGNEVAVLHIRHMIGGRVASLENERLFRVEFPERPGALGSFLDSIGSAFNISTFHYRNHGSAYGRVLVGLQVPDAELAAFRLRLKEIGYRHWDESENPAYQLFLR